MAFNAWYQPNCHAERFVFVGCVHKTDANILSRLAQVTANPPDYLIFTGDVTGSEELEEFKRLFYNHVYNRARRELGIGTSAEQNITYAELLGYVGHDPPSPDHTLADGYRDLMHYQLRLEGLSSTEADKRVSTLESNEIAYGIHHIARDFEYYGPWVKTLPEAVRRGVVATLKQDAEKLVAAIKPMQDAGTKIIMVGGNWDDAGNTADNMIGEGIEVFDTIPFFREHGIEFFDQIGYQVTKRTILVILPYWELQNFTEKSSTRLEHAIATADREKPGKTIITVAHGAPTWQVHNPNAVDEPTGDRKTIIDTLGRLLARIEPDEVIHGHEHNPLKSSVENPLPLNTHYILQTDDGKTHLVENRKHFGRPGQIIGSYIPFQQFGMLNIPLKTDSRPRLFSGDREPVHVF
ncbi:MAG: hypothetical protein ABIH36_01625 [bacterium]